MTERGSVLVRNVMSRGVVTCPVDSSVEEMARLIIDNDVSALVITDERLDACGVVTKIDLTAHYGKDLSTIRAEDIMSTSLITISPDAAIEEAAAVMSSRHVHQLVVVTETGVHRRPVGILTLADIVGLMGGRDPSERSPGEKKCAECVRHHLTVSGREESD